ncbi:MAG: alcohol dehydrogenase catalytic domain-containing protein [Armatimonadia bacterium]
MAEQTVKAMVLEQVGQPLVLREFPVPAVEPGAVLMRVLAAGICGSDLDITSGKDPRVALPMILGHEGIGEIVAVGGE